MSKYVNIGYESNAQLIDDCVKRMYWINNGANFELQKKWKIEDCYEGSIGF